MKPGVGRESAVMKFQSLDDTVIFFHLIFDRVGVGLTLAKDPDSKWANPSYRQAISTVPKS